MIQFFSCFNTIRVKYIYLSQYFKGQLQNLPKILFLGYFNAGFLEPSFWLGAFKKNKEGKK